MKLIIIKENFDIKRVIFRESKNSIKLSYDINYISMIGITIKINSIYILDKGTFLIIKIGDKDKKLLNTIDNYFSKKIENYDNILVNDTIKVKKHNEYISPKGNDILITMNSIKSNPNMRNKVQIFSI